MLNEADMEKLRDAVKGIAEQVIPNQYQDVTYLMEFFLEEENHFQKKISLLAERKDRGDEEATKQWAIETIRYRYMKTLLQKLRVKRLI